MHEITLQRGRAFCGPGGKAVCLVVVDVDASQGANKQTVVSCDSQAGQENMGESTWKGGMMVFKQFLLVDIKTVKTQVGCNPYHVISLQDTSNIMFLQWL